MKFSMKQTVEITDEINAQDVLDFMMANLKDCYREYGPAWKINDRISHLVQDRDWIMFLDQQSPGPFRPEGSAGFVKRLAHEIEVVWLASNGYNSSPVHCRDYLRNTEEAMKLIPEGCGIRIVGYDNDESLPWSVELINRDKEYTATKGCKHPAVGIVMLVLEYLAEHDSEAKTCTRARYHLGTKHFRN